MDQNLEAIQNAIIEMNTVFRCSTEVWVKRELQDTHYVKFISDNG